MYATYAPAAGLHIEKSLHDLLCAEILPASAIDPNRFFRGLADTVHRLAPLNQELLARRLRLQHAIDEWHKTNGVGNTEDYLRFLKKLGYVNTDAPDFSISPTGVDEELSRINAPQLVVPVTNARYSLNAVNARWGSLYDALYGTDALGTLPATRDYDPVRGRSVIEWVRTFLDDCLPLAGASHHETTAYFVERETLVATLLDGTRVGLKEPLAFTGFRGTPSAPTTIFLTHHGLKLEITIDRQHPVGTTDLAGVCDVALEAATTAIIDFEDSVATVDAADKCAAYRNWLGLMTGALHADVTKADSSFVRSINPDRRYTSPDGSSRTLRSRALLLARTVGHLMTTDAVLGPDGAQIPEGILDTFVVAAAGLADLSRPPSCRNSRHGSIYMVKPKMHGPDEVAFAIAVMQDVERVLDLPAGSIKIGIMDEERRTSVNLSECIRPAADRVVFINTGFLDRTGDEIHTSMWAGPMVRKNDMRHTAWITAYEDRNVSTGLRCGFAGRAQIGKGMWAMPEQMESLLAEKLGHPSAGANCAWVPSPTAATLHATHYHRVSVTDRQQQLAAIAPPDLTELLIPPVISAHGWTDADRRLEIDNNIQGILGYVVRWIDQGIGCSKVPDISGVALMEDRATCRISSQHVANWLLHDVVSTEEVVDSFRRMATMVDRQNADDSRYRPMAQQPNGPAFQAALRLVLDGTNAPSGYTEPTLHAYRRKRKQLDDAVAREA